MRCTECQKPIRPVVAVDIDGTLGDYHGDFLTFAERYCDRPFNLDYNGSCEMHEHMGLDLAEYRAIKLAYRQGGGKRLMPVYGGAWHFLDAIKPRAEIWLTTTRPYNKFDSTDPDTRHWLHKHQLPYDHLLYDDDKYHTLAAVVEGRRMVAVVDDLPSELQRAQECFGPVGILRSTRYNDAIPWEGATVKTLFEARFIISTRIEAWEQVYGRPEHTGLS